MLILVPIFLLLAASLAVLILSRARPGFGYAWVVASLSSLAVWLMVLLLRGAMPVSFTLGSQPLKILAPNPMLSLDASSWPYALTLETLALAAVLTATAQLHPSASPAAWAGTLAIAALALVAVLAADALTLLVAWVAMDLMDVALTLVFSNGKVNGEQIVLSFAARLAGTLFVLWAVVSGGEKPQQEGFAAIQPQAGLFLLFGIGLRFGVLPTRSVTGEETPFLRGWGNMLKLAPAASALVLLARLPREIVPQYWLGFFLAMTGLAALYGSVCWAAATDEISGRPFWLIGLASLSIASGLMGKPQAGVAWGLTLLLSGSILFLYSERRFALLSALGFWGLSGLPFSPTSGGWSGLITGNYPLGSAAFLLAHFFLVFGYLRHAFRAAAPTERAERWVLIIYPLGLAFLPLTDIYLGFLGLGGSPMPAFWWAGLISCLPAIALAWGLSRRKAESPERPDVQVPVLGHIAKVTGSVLGFGWLFRLFRLGFRTARWLVEMLAGILEGDAGILWVLVLLALLVTLISQAGGA
jgi:hypothetical protein